MQTNNKNSEPIKIAIIGAGLGGLCLAQGLRKYGVSCQVFEKDPEANSRTQGYRIRIDQTGQQALSACLSEELYNLFRATCIPSIGVNTLNGQMEPANKWIVTWEDGQEDKWPDLKANRLTMREILLYGLDEQVHFNKKFVSYQKQGDGKVCLNFENGTNYKADIAIAADGINSRLSALRFPGNKVVDTGSVCLYGKTLYTEKTKRQVAEVLQTGTSVIFENEIAMIADAMQFNSGSMSPARENEASIQLTYTEDYIYWALIGTRNRFGLADGQELSLSSEELIIKLKKITELWGPSLKVLFELADPEALTIVPVKTSLPKEKWDSDAVTALGDAIHAMSPAGGLGANTALYDAAVLARNLSKVSFEKLDLIKGIADFEEKMRQHSFAAVNASQAGASLLYNQSV